MAKYKSGEEAQVGDIAVCCSRWLQGAQFACRYQVSEVCDFPSLSTAELICFHEFGKSTYAASMFDLVSRAPAQPKEQPMQEQPLVVWPEEEKQLTYKDVGHGELFVFIDTPQVVLRKVTYGAHVIFGDVFDSYDNASYHLDRTVRRLKLTTPPQFTVI